MKTDIFLREKQELNNFFEINLDLLCIANTKGEFIKVNKAWSELLGYTKTELEAMKFLDFIHPDDLESTQKTVNKLKNNQKITEFINRYKDKTGKYHFIEWNSKAKGDYIYAAARDITDKIVQNEKIKNQKERLNFIIEGTNAGTWEWNIQTGKTFFNEKWVEMLGYKLEEIEPTTIETWRKYTHPKDLKRAEKELEKHFKGEIKQYDVEIRMKHKDGHWVWMNDRGRVVSWTKDNEPLKMFGIHLDITERKEQQEKLKYEHQFQKTLAEISSSLLEVNSASIDRKINSALKKIGEFFDVDRSYIFIFSNDHKQMSNSHEWYGEDIEAQKESLQEIPSDIFPWLMEQLTLNKMINIPDISKMEKKAAAEQNLFEDLNLKSLIVMPMFIENELFGFFGFDSVKNKKEFSKKEIRLLRIFTDTIINTFSKHLNDKRIRELTYKDSLTGLYNRRYFEEELDRLDTKRQLPISIIMGDLNGLKIINDSLGHKKGDQLLKKSAEILKEATRKEDILARQGGDEFAILLPKTKKEIAEKIIARIKEKSRQTNDDELTVTIALGTAVKTVPDQSIEDVLRTADNAMYQNKLSESKSAKNRIINSLLHNLEVKSNETIKHTERMKKLAFDFGKELGIAESELNRLSLLAKLHDIGKTTIAEKILKKPDELTDKEWKIIKEHPEKGYQIASSSHEFAVVAEDIFAHHERWDGKGYPRRLKEKAISYLARIIFIIDAYDVMTNDRSYSKAVSKKKALAEIKKCSGSQFDPELAEEFIKMMKSN